MPTIITHQLSFQLDTGEWLFRNINFSLTQRLTGLVGRNGAGKSVFLALLQGKRSPTQGNVTHQAKIESYSQLPSELLNSQQRISDYLGIDHKLSALKAIEQGSCDTVHFDVIGEDWDIAERAQHTLLTLGITADLSAYCRTLSGGQLARLQLYRVFESDADILLLDEPSNHLDAKGKQWLIEQLKHFSGKVLLVSHDRQLLRHVEGIYQLTSLGLRYFQGNFDDYWAQSTTQADSLDKHIAQLKSEQKKIKRQAQANQEKAQQREAQGNRLRKSGSQSKILLDKKKDSAGQSRSAAIANQHNQLARSQIKLHALEHQKESLKPQAIYIEPSCHHKKHTLLKVEYCPQAFGATTALSFTLANGERCHLLGANGCGKSTLLKTIHRQDTHTTIKRYGDTVYLDQHFGLLERHRTMIDSLMGYCHGLAESDARTLLAGIGFRRDSVHRAIEHLSGGEKMKLAMLMVSHLPDYPLLLLDEPDNHLDIEAKQLLAAALKTYNGAFILVSHDTDFVAEIGVDRVIPM